MHVAKTLLLISIVPLFNLPSWSEQWPDTVEQVCASHEARICRLIEAIDPSAPGLESVQAAFEQKNLVEVCHRLLSHYGNRFPGTQPKRSGTDDEDHSFDVDAVLNDQFVFYGVEDTVPRSTGGGLDWNWRGPTDDREWAWALNRHSFLSTLLDAWRNTGNPVYVRKIDALIKDWVISNPYTGEKGVGAAWRGLEVALRMKHWKNVFTALQNEPDFTPAVKLLMLSSLPDHAHYLRHFHASGDNWLTMEMNGLAIIATTWPELRDSCVWLDYTLEKLIPSLDEQVHLDGAQTELTSHYHRVALINFQEFADTLEAADRAVPENFLAGLERMWNYLAYTMRPNGHGLLNNDSDYDYTRPHILAAATRYQRPDWTYIASNGQQGSPPQRPLSVSFPCAGQVIFRGGYFDTSEWACFDIGPLGTSHVHYDKLHLSVMVGGRDILVDSGRYTYVGGPWRDYFTGSSSHNVILVDGHGQKNYPARNEQPLNGWAYNGSEGIEDCFPESLSTSKEPPDFIIAPTYTYARGRIEHGYWGVQGRILHTRIVLRHESVDGLVVLDYVDTDRPREITALWHFHPDCEVLVEDGVIKTNDAGRPNLSLLPLGNLQWDISLIKGQETPGIQGWYSPVYNTKVPAYTAVCTTTISESAVFAWLLCPDADIWREMPVLALDSDGWASIATDALPGSRPLLRVSVQGNGTPEIR